MSKIIIVSNRLPVKILKEESGYQFEKSPGGLATGLSPLHESGDSIWIGWPGLEDSAINTKDKNDIINKLKDLKCHPVFLSKEELDNYYYGFSNKTIWPLFHYFSLYTTYKNEYWQSYQKVNEIFCDEIMKFAKEEDEIWIQDYHLMLLPQMLRKKLPKASIGFFLHIPFPSSELYRQMPYREEILHGLLGADLVGFHTYYYVRHFHETVRRILGHEHVYGQINLPNRTVRTDAFPISIDYQKYRDSGDIPEVKKYIDEFKARFGDKKIILSIDRLDYSKGIPNRLEAFNIFLEKYPEYLGKVYLIIGAVPSRTQVDTYEQLKERVDKLVGQINGKYGTLDWIPIHYMYRSLPFDKLTAVYNISDIAMITPIRDGMNLVAKEFVAAKKDGRGVLILSESAGASQELSEAIIINPNDYDSIAEALKQALVMPEEEQIQRNRPMQERIERYDINRWAHDFMERLRQEKIQQYALFSKNLVGDVKEELIQKYREAKSRLLMLDYDGTLVGFAKRPEDARPDEEVYKILSELAKNPRNNVVIVSGRNKDSLDRWFGNMDNISIIAEHGTWIKYPGENWETLEQISAEWKSEIKPILELFVDRTPGALLEEKDYSLVWHYRNVNPSLVPVRVNELKNILINFTGNLNIGMLDGNKVIEIKNTGINKGAAANKLMQMDSWEFVMAIGDDVTDEDMFKALPESSETIKVGFQRSHARFNLKTISEVRNLLNQLIKE